MATSERRKWVLKYDAQPGEVDSQPYFVGDSSQRWTSKLRDAAHFDTKAEAFARRLAEGLVPNLVVAVPVGPKRGSRSAASRYVVREGKVRGEGRYFGNVTTRDVWTSKQRVAMRWDREEAAVVAARSMGGRVVRLRPRAERAAGPEPTIRQLLVETHAAVTAKSLLARVEAAGAEAPLAVAAEAWRALDEHARWQATDALRQEAQRAEAYKRDVDRALAAGPRAALALLSAAAAPTGGV